MKACKDCKHMYSEYNGIYFYPICRISERIEEKESFFDGIQHIRKYIGCNTFRESSCGCGEEARFWKPTFLYRIKRLYILIKTKVF